MTTPLAARRIRAVHMHTDLLAAMLKGQFHRIAISDAPADLEVFAVMYGDRPNMIVLRVTSASFDPVPEGQEIPRIDFTYTEAS